MADFKLGISGSELDLPLGVAEELPTEAEDSVQDARMQDSSWRYDFAEKTRRTWRIEFVELTAAGCATLDTIDGYKKILNYINGYQGLAAGVAVVVASWSRPTLKVTTSGLTTIKYRGTMVLKEAN
jgi:hypothetical protein